MLRFLARFLAAVFALVFVAVTVPIIFFHAAGTRLAQPQVYKDALAKERFYDRFPALAADVVTRATEAGAREVANRGGAGGALPVNLLHQLSPADWESLFGAILPPDYLRQQAEKALDQFFGWVHSDAPDPVVKIELGELKRRLVAPETEEVYVRILKTKPPCTASDLQAAGFPPIDCCPPPEAMPEVRKNFHTLVQMAAGQVPETVDLFKVPKHDRPAAEEIRRLAEVRTRLAQMEWLAQWSPVVPAALLLLVAVFAARSFRSCMFWWGIPCLTAGAVSAAVALSTVPAGDWVFTHIFLRNLPANVPATTLQALAGLVAAVVQPVMDAALHNSCSLAIGGIAAVILGVLFKPLQKSTGEANGALESADRF